MGQTMSVLFPSIKMMLLTATGFIACITQCDVLYTRATLPRLPRGPNFLATPRASTPEHHFRCSGTYLALPPS